MAYVDSEKPRANGRASSTQSQGYCIIDGCENPLSPRSRLNTCKTCRGSMGMWLRRRPAEIIERRRKLHMYDARMEQLVDYKADKKARGYK